MYTSHYIAINMIITGTLYNARPYAELCLVVTALTNAWAPNSTGPSPSAVVTKKLHI